MPHAAPTAAPADERGGIGEMLRRVTSMPLAEIAGRGRQEAWKLVDRVSWRRSIDAAAILRDHAPALARPDSALQTIRQTAPQRFFAGVEAPSRVAESLPQHCAVAVERAAATLVNRFDLLGYRTLWFGDPIDWHVDPVLSRRAPRVHWTHLNPLDAAVVGDSKVIWELNRHQWIARLAQAYAVTGDERYAEHALRSIESWIDANPFGVGVNWASSLEVAYRIMSWSWTLMLVRHSTALTGERLAVVLAHFWLHATHVARYLSHYFSPNTHLTGEALGLFYAGTLLPEFREARRWRETGAEILIAQGRSQIGPDGVHFERSTCYHRYTVETYQQFLLLAERTHLRVPVLLCDRVRRAADFLLSVRRPDGMLPEIGDADGGRLLPLVERDQCDPRGVLGVAAAMFGRSDFAWGAEGLTPEVLWLMGEAGERGLAALGASPAPVAASRLFPMGGYCVMKSGAQRDAHQLIVDVGPLGCSFSCGHGHADLLSVQCSAFGEPILVDAGTYCYTPEMEWRNYFRGTAAHSALVVDGRDQVAPGGPFSWCGRADVLVREWRSGVDHDFIDASHDAYPGITHRRRVLFVKPDYWVIVDDVENGVGGNFRLRQMSQPKITPDPVSLELGFQFAPMDVEIVKGEWARARTPGGNTFWVASFASGGARAVVRSGELSPIRGWISRDYGQRVPAPLLVYTTRAHLPWRSITVLMPKRHTTARTSVAHASGVATPGVSLLVDDRNLPIGLDLDDRGESIFVDDTEIFWSANH
jgi:hypothetical protein